MKKNNLSIFFRFFDLCFCFCFSNILSLFFCICSIAFLTIWRWTCWSLVVIYQKHCLNVGYSFVWKCTFWFVRHYWLCRVFCISCRFSFECSHLSNVPIEFLNASVYRVLFSVSVWGLEKRQPKRMC